jgi:uncharacterized protein (DUF1786 family)
MLMNESKTILCLDVGSGTQDVLYYDPDRELENCPKFVLPSPAVRVAQRISELSARGRDIYLYGGNMGGGFGRALDEHLRSGLRAAAHPDAALAMSDDPDRVRARGVELSEKCPAGYAPLKLTDFEAGFWQALLAQAGLEYPDMVVAAAQDHGFHPESSNRKGRFDIWKDLLHRTDGRVEDLLFLEPPPELTRLLTLQQSIGGGPVSDSGSAAALGALSVPEVEQRSWNPGVCVVNVGNSHTTGFLIRRGRVEGVYEHHTGLLDGNKLWNDLMAFSRGNLTDEDVFADQGHGCHIRDWEGPYPESMLPVYVLGPRRGMLGEFDVEFLVPGGDMMLAGCFGLLKGWEYKQGRIGLA